MLLVHKHTYLLHICKCWILINTSWNLPLHSCGFQPWWFYSMILWLSPDFHFQWNNFIAVFWDLLKSLKQFPLVSFPSSELATYYLTHVLSYFFNFFSIHHLFMSIYWISFILECKYFCTTCTSFTYCIALLLVSVFYPDDDVLWMQLEGEALISLFVRKVLNSWLCLTS